MDKRKKNKNKVIENAVLVVIVLSIVFSVFVLFSKTNLNVSALEQENGTTQNGATLNLANPENSADDFVAEIIYSQFNYSDRKIKYNLQVYIDKNKMLAGQEGTDRELNGEIIDLKMKAIKIELENEGLTVTLDDKGTLLSTDIKTFKSAHERALMDPSSNGYEKYDPKEGLVHYGFYKKTYSFTSKTVFNDISKSRYLTIANDAVSTMPGVNESNLKYIYNYGTYITSKTITTNAHKTYPSAKEKIYIHEFVMTKGTLSTQEVTITQKVYNSTGWNITLLAAVLVALICVIVVRAVKTKKDSGNKEDQTTQIVT